MDAVVGRDLGAEIIENKSLFTEDISYSRGIAGNALSHLLLWQYSFNNNLSITVAEDDCFFRLDFNEYFSTITDLLPPDWDIVHWGWNFDSILSLKLFNSFSNFYMYADQDLLRMNIENFRACNVKPFILELNSSYGLPCYSISPKGAAKLTSGCFPLSNINKYSGDTYNNTGLDVAMSTVYPKIQSYICLPPLVATSNTKDDSTANKFWTAPIK